MRFTSEEVPRRLGLWFESNRAHFSSPGLRTRMFYSFSPRLRKLLTPRFNSNPDFVNQHDLSVLVNTLRIILKIRRRSTPTYANYGQRHFVFILAKRHVIARVEVNKEGDERAGSVAPAAFRIRGSVCRINNEELGSSQYALYTESPATTLPRTISSLSIDWHHICNL